MPTLKLSGKDDTWVNYQFRASGPINMESGEQEEVSGHEIEGTVGPGTDEIPFSGVPIDFNADKPWQLDIDLDIEIGFADWRPTYLNAGTLELRAAADTATYQFKLPEPGMVLIGGDGPDRGDEIVTQENTFGRGSSTGGIDTYRFWPAIAIDVVADDATEWRIPDATDPDLREWSPVSVYIPEMSF